MARSKEKSQAYVLRRRGYSIKEIAKKLNVSVGSVSNWCRDIVLTQDQLKKLQMRVTDPYYGKKGEYLFQKMKETNEKINRLRLEGMKEVGKITKRELFLTGIALYWGEGFKKDNQVGFATSDANMANFFLLWLNRCFSIEKKDLLIRVTANISYKGNIDAIEKFWAQYLNISPIIFSKPFFQQSTWKKEYENKNEYHGVIRIRVRRSTDFLRKIHGYIRGLTKNVII